VSDRVRARGTARADWEREFEVDGEALRRAAGMPRTWRLLGAGWDCDAWLADDAVVWRVPRRHVGIDALEIESALLPALAPYLPVRVPVPRMVEADGLPALARHTLVPGRELAEAERTDHAALGTALGRFLQALHDPALVAGPGAVLPLDPLARNDPSVRVPRAHARLEQVAARVDAGALGRIVDAGAGPPLDPTVVCHCDLHPRHVLVDGDGALAGVIDWGDSCIGARAVDLAIVTYLDADGRRAFFDVYGAVEDAEWRHARVLAVMLGASLLAADPDGASGRAALGWLERLATEAP